LEIAERFKIVQKDGAWTVPSQHDGKKYTINLSGVSPSCSCDDYETRRDNCKHIYAVLHLLSNTKRDEQERKQEQAAARVRPTYRQNWANYNKAQTTEKTKLLFLLHQLCQGIADPVSDNGRPRLPLRDMIFCACLKTYTKLSGRRLVSDLQDAFDKGYISQVPHYNSVFNHLENEALTEALQALITEASLPLKTVETQFSVDSTGLSVNGYIRWYNARYERELDGQDWVKMHLMCGTQTNIVTSVEISGRYDADCPYFRPLVKRTAQNFAVCEVSADKAYLSRKNMQAVVDGGGIPYVMFKRNSIEDGEGYAVWEKMFHLYSFKREEFLSHYHRRSNVESTVWMIKSKFGDQLRTKGETSQINEALTKVLCHNVCVVIQSMYELGIEPTFWGGAAADCRVEGFCAEKPLAQEVRELALV
jgi:transposase